MRRGPPRSAGTRSARSASAGACRWRSSGGSPTTATSWWSRAGSTPTGRPNPGAPRARPHPGPRADQRRHRPRAAGRPADASPGGPGAWRAARGRRSTAGARDGPGRGPARPPRFGEPRRRATRCSTSTTRRSEPTRSPDRGAAPPCCASRARPRRSSPRPTATRASASTDPWLGAALSVAEATRNVSITGARPLGVTNCLNYGDPTRPEAFWQLTEGVRGLGDACRALGLPVTGGNVSLYNESPTGAIAPTPEIGVVGLLDDVATLVGPAFQTRARHGPAGRRADARVWPGRPTPRWPARPPRTARPAWTSPARRPSRPSSARRSRGVSWRRRRTSRVAGSRSPSPSARCGAGSGPASGSPVANSPAVDLFGESPSRLVLSCRPRFTAALELLARQHGLPVEAIGSVGGDRLVVELAGLRRDGRRRGARQPRGGCARGARSRTCATPGSTGSSRALGWEG